MTRRGFLVSAAAASTAVAASSRAFPRTGSLNDAKYAITPPLSELPTAAVTLPPDSPEELQRKQTQATLNALEDDALLRPVRAMGGISVPGPSLGGWYAEHGWAPSHCLGQWISALARDSALPGVIQEEASARRERVARLINGLRAMGPSALTVSFRENPFPSYCYDKLLLALMDADTICGTPGARAFMADLTSAAESALPAHAYSRNDMCEKPGLITKATSCLDENYTMPENQFLAWRLTGDRRYFDRGQRFLLNYSLFDPLAEGKDALIDQHAYSHLNAVSSGLEAYFATGDPKYRRAVENAFRFVEDQSYPTGGWGPEEAFVDPSSNKLFDDLTKTHRGFETPCGSYAHFKLSRRLLTLTKDSRYGDSMERVLYNTVLGALPLETDGRAFYYSDYNLFAAKTYFPDRWPCCAGSLTMVATDYHRNLYFQGDNTLYVNLYRPSRVIWNGIQLTQSGGYPLSGDITLRVAASKPITATVTFRIPTWANNAELSINGKRLQQPIAAGAFLPVAREWRDGDVVELQLPLALRLQPLDSTLR